MTRDGSWSLCDQPNGMGGRPNRTVGRTALILLRMTLVALQAAPCSAEDSAIAPPGYGQLAEYQLRILREPTPQPPIPALDLDLAGGPEFTEAERQVQREAGRTILPLVAKAYDAGDSSVVIPPGDYRFGQETWDRYGPVYPLQFSHLRRDDSHPFAIDANGVTLWFDLGDDEAATCHFCVAFIECSNVIFRGATIDRGSRGNIEGRITAIDAPLRRFEIQPSPGTVVPTRFNGSLEQRVLPFKKDGRFCAPLYALQAGGVHLRYRDVVPSDAPGRYWVSMADAALFDTMRDAAWLSAYGDLGTLTIGDGLSCIYSVATAISLTRSERLTMQGLRVHVAKGGGEEIGGFGAHLWKDCYFGPRPGSGQWQGGDGFMFDATRHGTTFDHVTIVHSSDDPANIHGYWSEVASVADANVHFGAGASAEPVPAGARDINVRGLPVDVVPGDRVRFYERSTARALGEATVVAIADKRTAVLDHRIHLVPGAMAEWPDHQCAGWTIQECLWQDDYQRLLIQSGPGTVRHCTFTRLGSRIEINCVLTGIEGGVAHDVDIADNVFTDVSPQPHGSAIGVYFRAYQPTQARILSRLSISGNTIDRAGGAAIELIGIDHAVVERNRLIGVLAQTALARPGDPRAHQAIQISDCASIAVAGNILIDDGSFASADGRSGTPLLSVDRASTDVTLEGTPLP